MAMIIKTKLKTRCLLSCQKKILVPETELQIGIKGGNIDELKKKL